MSTSYLDQRLVYLSLLTFTFTGFLGCTTPGTSTQRERESIAPETNRVVATQPQEDQERTSVQTHVKQDLTEGISHYEKEEYDQAIDRFCDVLHHDPRKHSDKPDGDELDTTSKMTNRKAELDSMKKDALFYRGLAFLEKGFPNTAVEDFNEVLSMDPQDARTYVQRGRAYAELSAWYEAVRDCTQAIRLDPSSGMAYYYRGWAYMNWDKSKLAIADLREAVRLTPEYAEEARQYIGHSYQCWYDSMRDDGEQQKADAIYLEACEVLAAMADSLGSSDNSIESESRYLVAKPVTVEHFDTHYQEGLQLLESGDLVAAIAEFNRSIQIDPDREEAYLKCGLAYLKRGFPNTAIAFFRKTRAKGLKSSELYRLMAQAYDEMGEELLVPRYATQAIMLDSQNAEAYRIRGVAYLNASEITLAKKDLGEAIRLDPSMKDELRPLLERSVSRNQD